MDKDLCTNKRASVSSYKFSVYRGIQGDHLLG